jgi:predicted TIM-barrel fold metal-dependent hydrolase
MTTLDTMSARQIDKSKAAMDKVPALVVSADSHVDEPFDLWDGLPAAIRERMHARRPLVNRPAGGMDSSKRVADMDLDGLAAEILYPSHSMRLFDLDQEAQEAIFPVYNDWLAGYCKAAPKRLYGVPCIPTYDIDFAIRELERCRKMGLLGLLVWREPHPDLPFTHPTHYERLWAAAAEMGAPVNLHTLTGFNYHSVRLQGIERVRGAVNTCNYDGINALFNLIWSGVCDRHPKIKFEFVEAEIGWLPWILQQWDYYFHRFARHDPGQEQFPIKRKPSEIFADHIYFTFMHDPVGASLLDRWGEKNCMWSSDYPHPNMTWPNSRAFIAAQIGDLPASKKKRLCSENVIELYGLKF